MGSFATHQSTSYASVYEANSAFIANAEMEMEGHSANAKHAVCFKCGAAVYVGNIQAKNTMVNVTQHVHWHRQMDANLAKSIALAEDVLKGLEGLAEELKPYQKAFDVHRARLERLKGVDFSDQRKTKVTRYQLPKALRTELKEFAKDASALLGHTVTESDVVRLAVLEYFDKHSSNL